MSPIHARTHHQDIRIGTLAGRGERTAAYIGEILSHGFESFQLNFHKRKPEGMDLKKLARQVRSIIDEAESSAVISSFGIFGNPLQDKEHVKQLKQAIDACETAGCSIVASFAGALDGQPVEEAIKPWAKVWRPLVKRAEDRGVRLVIENCPMGGTWHAANWNIGFCPRAWEMMFNEINSDHLGLEWEPAHQMIQLIDPISQLRQWIHKIYHVHGKDASIDWNRLRTHGTHAGLPPVISRHPGFGDTNWTDVISILRQHGYRGFIDIEGWHDPIYAGDLELTGQVHALNHLKHCRGGDFVETVK
ncbi:sugar phosphate isomerase/epimerase family protein [Phycisphaerales bacterium AB-hyl4]|uniref:Sugar phosphate isomerase/epimerase family protein n=1 Tax=Natronomicrosphaera hydrolytica TaxID=3242702 RepID=A0ABV4U8Q5_9BACT